MTGPRPRLASDAREETALEKDQHRGGAGLAGVRQGSRRAEGGAEAKVEGATWPLLLHASSGHRPGSTVLQLVSARPRLPLLRPLSLMGRQTPSLPVCPAAALKTSGRERQKNPTFKKKKDKMPPQSRTQVRGEWEKLQRSPWKSPHNWGVGWEVEPQSGVGWGQWSSDPGGQSGLPQATGPQRSRPQWSLAWDHPA